ncbi:hypothetical protein FKB34_01990 [Glycocaulis profundi]|nr:hypothetical protein FKB34_01990 [Glycocaulis profundi]
MTRPVSILQRIQIRRVYTENVFSGTYKRHHIDIEREPRDTRVSEFYIRVLAPNGRYAYDGWWSPGDERDMDQAVMEALHGAELLPRDSQP